MVPRLLICSTERLVSADSSDMVLGMFQRLQKAGHYTCFQFTESEVALHPLPSSWTKIGYTSEFAFSRLTLEKLALKMLPLDGSNVAGMLSVHTHLKLNGICRFEIVELVIGCQQHSHTKAGAANGFNIVLSSGFIVGVSRIRIIVEVQNLSVRDDMDYDALERVHHEAPEQ